jgi:hypothetical protein
MKYISSIRYVLDYVLDEGLIKVDKLEVLLRLCATVDTALTFADLNT